MARILVLGALITIAGVSSLQAQTTGQRTGTLHLRIPDKPFDGVASRFRHLARRDDKARRWHRALLRWQVVAAFSPKDREAAQRIGAIETWIKKQAEKYMAEAAADLKKKQYGAAFRSFLKVLAYDGDNAHALQMIKFDLNARSVQDYQVVKGDNPVRIAKKAYGNEELVFLVQYFNNLKRNARLRPGSKIKIPVLADVLPARPVQVAAAVAPPTPVKPASGTPGAGKAQAATKAPAKPEAPAKEKTPAPVASAKPEPLATEKTPAPVTVATAETKTPAKEEAPAPIAPTESTLVAALEAGGGAAEVLMDLSPEQGKMEYDRSVSDIGLRHAQALFDAGQFADSAAQAEQVLEEDPVNTKAREMINASYYALGNEQYNKGELLPAMQSYSRVTPGYKDATERKKELSGKLKDQQAEVHYIAGVTFFLEEDLDGAIREWDQVLKLDPGHPQATKDLANARSLKARLAKVQ